MSKPRITYIPHPDTTHDQKLDVLAAVYRFVLECHAEKKAAGQSGPDDAKEIDDDRATRIIPS